MLMTTDELKIVRKWLEYQHGLVNIPLPWERRHHLPEKESGRRLFDAELAQALRLLIQEAEAEAELSGYHENLNAANNSWLTGLSTTERQALSWMCSQRDAANEEITGIELEGNLTLDTARYLRKCKSTLYSLNHLLAKYGEPEACEYINHRYKEEKERKEQAKVGSNAHSFHTEPA